LESATGAVAPVCLGLIDLGPAVALCSNPLLQELALDIDLGLQVLALLLALGVGQLSLQLQDSVVRILLDPQALLHAIGVLLPHAHGVRLGGVLHALGGQLPLHLRAVLLGLGQALRAFDRGGIVRGSLGQRFAVFLLADLALLEGQVKLLLFLGQGSCCLGCRIVLVVQAGERRFRLGYALVGPLRRVLLRLTLFYVGDFFLDVLAGLGVLRFLRCGEHPSSYCLGPGLVEIAQLLVQTLSLRQRAFVGGVQVLESFAPLFLNAAPLFFLLQGLLVESEDVLPLGDLFLDLRYA